MVECSMNLFILIFFKFDDKIYAHVFSSHLLTFRTCGKYLIVFRMHNVFNPFYAIDLVTRIA